MTALLNLKPETAKQLHPMAVRWFDELSATIEQQLSIDGLTADDIKTFLSVDEKRELWRHKSGIEVALLTCTNPDTAYLGSPIDCSAGPAFLMMQLRSLTDTENIKSLLRKVYERKAATRSAAMRKQDELKRRTRAFEALNPPIALAKKYLNCTGEYVRFEMSMNGAVDAYLEAGEFYINQEKASEYRRCLVVIEDRRQQDMRKQRAQSVADAYNHRLNEEMRELTTQLHRREKGLSTYFRTTVQDKRYSGHSFEYILSEQQRKELDLILISIANKQLERLCSEDLRQFIILPFRYYKRYFPLPSASYSFEEMPCLDFGFDIFAAICTEIWLKPGKKSFDGFEFPLPSIEGKNGLSLLKSPRFLGYYYSISGPEELNFHVFWKSIPLILLKGLLNGEIRAQGTTISAASDEGITYRIPKLEAEITIPNAFADYLRAIGNIDQMVSMNILTKKVADIVKSELIGLAQTCEVSSSKERVKQQDTKKARLYQLFDMGKRPGDPEVKALDIRPNTVYRYYQSWKKKRNHP
ncbi:MAG: hypothetical protein ACOC6O_02940 [Chloroflexota bacterium]